MRSSYLAHLPEAPIGIAAEVSHISHSPAASAQPSGASTVFGSRDSVSLATPHHTRAPTHVIEVKSGGGGEPPIPLTLASDAAASTSRPGFAERIEHQHASRGKGNILE